MITHTNNRINLRGVAKAAASANVSRWHVYLCLRGERKQSASVANAIATYVVPLPAAPKIQRHKKRPCNHQIMNPEKMPSAKSKTFSASASRRKSRNNHD